MYSWSDDRVGEGGLVDGVRELLRLEAEATVLLVHGATLSLQTKQSYKTYQTHKIHDKNNQRIICGALKKKLAYLSKYKKVKIS